MKALIPKFLVLLCLVSLSTISHGLEIGEKFPKKAPIVPASEGFEMTFLEINLGLDGKVKYVRCKGCNDLQFTVDSSTRLYMSGQALPIDSIYKFNRHAADIVYDPKTLVLLEVSVHTMEGDS